MAYLRKLIHIDEDLCNGCGQCVPGCAEGALKIIDGKARLVAEKYCDGLGACLGHCPTGALTVTEVAAEDFDPEAVRALLAQEGREIPEHMPAPEELRLGPAHKAPHAEPPRSGCPGAAAMTLRQSLAHPSEGGQSPCARANQPVTHPAGPNDEAESFLGHWPVQLRLAPPDAPFLKDADLLLTADCVPVALPDFHRNWVPGRAVLLACPKFDDAQAYVDKLAAILQANPPARVTVLEMEVPCCSAYSRILLTAMAKAGVHVPAERVVVSRRGGILRREALGGDVLTGKARTGQASANQPRTDLIRADQTQADPPARPRLAMQLRSEAPNG